MTSGGSSVGSMADISAIVGTEAKTTSIEICGSDYKLSVGASAASSLPSLPQHDPYTPRKRRDPDYVPYYVTNFEYILRCVIDCTDDRDLFNSQEIGTVWCPSLSLSLSLSLSWLFVKLTKILPYHSTKLIISCPRAKKRYRFMIQCATSVSDPDSNGSALILVDWIR
jgi:hypothetical protein